MPPRRKKKTAPHAYASVVDTPEIIALATGYARQGYHKSGYEQARRFANGITSKSLAARAKPDGTHAPARFAYATGVEDPEMGGIFAVGTSASDLVSELRFKDARALRTAFDNSFKNPVRHVHPQDASMQGTQLAVLKGMPVFKFKDVAAVKDSHTAVKASPSAIGAESIAAIYNRNAPALQTRQDAKRAFNDWRFEVEYGAK